MFVYEKDGFGMSVVDSCTPGHVSIQADSRAILDAEKVGELVAAMNRWLESQPKEQVVSFAGVAAGERFTLGGTQYWRQGVLFDCDGYGRVSLIAGSTGFFQKLYKLEEVTVVR